MKPAVAVFFRLLGLCAAVAAAAMPGAARAGIPSTTAIHAALTSSTGGPAADGDYNVAFRLYKDAQVVVPAWTEASALVTVKNGLFTYALGTKQALDAAAFSAAGPAPFLGVQIGQDPELPRKPLHSVLFAMRAGVAEFVECSGCVGAGQLDPQVLQAYAKSASLAKIATSGAYADLAGTPSLANVAMTGEYADLNGKPLVVKVGSACGSGLVVKGIKADGALDCIKAMDPGALPTDGLDEISNHLLWNQFVDTANGGSNVEIPDNNPDGATDTLDFPDIGTAQVLNIAIDISNSDISKLKVSIVDPNKVEYVLYDKGASGMTLTGSFPDKNPTVSGDLTTWVGKNPAGKWSLVVLDSGFLNNTTDGKINKWSISLQTLSNKKVQVKGALLIDGKVSAASDVDVAGTLNAAALQASGQPVSSNFKFAFIDLDFRNNAGTVAANGWADIPKRKLSYVKTRDASAIRIQYQDTLGTLGTGYGQCTWRILVDGNMIAQFSDADITYGYAWRMANATHTAIATGVKVGAHTIQVQTYRDAAATECLMGWNTSGSFLSAEEVGP